MKNMINAVTTVQPTNLEILLWRRMTLVGHDLDLGSTSSPTIQLPLPVSAPGHSHNGGGHPASCRWPQPRRRRGFLWRRTSGWSASSASYRHRRRAEPAAQEQVLRPFLGSVLRTFIPWRTRPRFSPLAGVPDFTIAFPRPHQRRCSRPHAAEEVPVMLRLPRAQAPPLPDAAEETSREEKAEAVYAEEEVSRRRVIAGQAKRAAEAAE